MNSNYNSRARSFFVFVRCDICGAQGKTYTSPEPPQEANWENLACYDAIRAWNMRTREGANIA